MNRERLEIGWYAVRPFLFYMVLFITFRAILYRLLESALLTASVDMTLYYEVWSDIAGILIIGISSAAAAIPVLKEGRREILLARRRSSRSWLEKRKDKGTLIGLLPFGTICLCAFCNLFLADEINRAPAKVQSALLEAMQEKQVTIGSQTFQLPNPFLVMATQNPIEQEGTYPLPEAQVDRFMLKVVIDYPSLEEEKKIIRENIAGEMPEVTPVTTADEILKARSVVREVYIDEKIEQYIADIVFATRYPERYGLKDLKDMISFGGSPRASINLAKAARAYAFIKRRGYVVPEDVRAVAHDVLRHRIGLTYEAEASNITSEEIVSKIINKVEVP